MRPTWLDRGELSPRWSSSTDTQGRRPHEWLLDRRLLAGLGGAVRTGALELSRRLGVARNTVSARLERLVTSGVVVGFGPEIDLTKVGYRVSAYVTLQIAQGKGLQVTDHLEKVHRTTGAGDLLCRVVAASNAHLAEVLDRILEVPGIDRTTTSLVLDTPVHARVVPAIEALSDAGPTGRRLNP